MSQKAKFLPYVATATSIYVHVCVIAWVNLAHIKWCLNIAWRYRMLNIEENRNHFVQNISSSSIYAKIFTIIGNINFRCWTKFFMHNFSIPHFNSVSFYLCFLYRVYHNVCSTDLKLAGHFILSFDAVKDHISIFKLYHICFKYMLSLIYIKFALEQASRTG